jgi:hypothetical protein
MTGRIMAVSIRSLAILFAVAVGVPPAIAADVSLTVPGRGNATPSIAAEASFVTVAWGASTSDGVTDVFAAVSRNAGQTFGSPVRVNDVAGDARLNGEQPPQVGLVRRPGRDPEIIVVWTSKGDAGTKLLHARSVDGGRTFGRSALVPGTDAPGNRGWQAINIEATGRVDVVWLDHRELASNTAMATTHHEHASSQKPDGVAMAQKSKLYIASLDGSLPPRALAGGVCYCCKTALASGAPGSIFAVWRHVYPGNLRDMAFSMSRDAGRTFTPTVRVSEDKWVLEGCPDDGPSMAVDSKGVVHVIWPTLVAGDSNGEPTIGIFYASTADGSHFGRREAIPTSGVPHHPRVVVGADGRLVAVWDESGPAARRIAVGRGHVDGAGRVAFSREVVGTPEAAVYPVIAVAGDTAVIVWTSGGSASSSIRVHRLAPIGERSH